MYILPLTLVSLSSLSSLVRAGSAPFGASCSRSDLRLQQGSFQLWTECDSMTFCAENNTCAHRNCTRDDYPFGYPPGSHLIPDKCPRGQFCPDEEDNCQPLIPVDGACQFNRDDQCEGAPNWQEITDTTGRGLNVNGSICLRNVCMWANKTLGTDCVVENTPFIAYGNSGEYPVIVSRGNCRPGLYCDAVSLKCMNEKPLGDACTADKECSTWNCLESGTCGKATNAPAQFGVWVYIVVALGIFAAMLAITFGLFLIHRKQRDEEREKRAQYWREQNAYHQTLRQMREAARSSIMSFNGKGGSARSTLYNDNGSDDSHHNAVPILQHGAPKGSGLRHYQTEDTGSDYDEAVVMQQDHRNRF